VKTRRIFLRYARKDALAARPFDSRPNTWKFLFESFPDFLGELKICRRVPGDLPFLRCRGDQRGRYRLWGRRSRTQRGRPKERQGGGGFEDRPA